jgi:enoyl-[acyl-carrier protein] reductase I
MPLDVRQPGELEAVFAAIRARWGRLDFLLHSIAFAPMADLHGRVVDCSLDGFLTAMDVSCHSFIRMARLAEPLMDRGGCLTTMTYIGSQRVVPNYAMMGPVKAALEATVRYLAAELGAKGIRVHAVSPGPILTRAASGIAKFDHLMKDVGARSPVTAALSIEDIGIATAALATDAASLHHEHGRQCNQHEIGRNPVRVKKVGEDHEMPFRRTSTQRFRQTRRSAAR